MQIPFINLQAQYQAYKQEIDESIQKVLNHSNYIMGPEISEFEKKLCDYTGCKHSITCANGTDALLLAMMAIDIKPGDEIITTPFTFIATAEVAAFLGAKPVFVDIDEKTYNINPSLIEKAITPKTKAIVPVSIFGQVSDMDEINEIAEKYKITVIEDAAQSFGAEYKGRKSCNLSKISATSFFPSKPLGCYGDGGAIFTNDDVIAEKLKALRVHGQVKRYVHKFVGLNGRLDTIQAAVLIVKLKYLDSEIKKRKEVADFYDKNLPDFIVKPFVKPDRTSVYAQYSIRVKDREKFISKLNELGVPTAVHYPIPLHLQEVFSELGYKKGDFPVSELVSEEILSLPMSPFLSKEELSYVIEVIKKISL